MNVRKNKSGQQRMCGRLVRGARRLLEDRAALRILAERPVVVDGDDDPGPSAA